MQLIDTDRYPIDRLDTPAGRDFVRAKAAEFARESVVVLPGFLTAEAVEAIRDEAAAKLDKTFHSFTEHNVFLNDDEGRRLRTSVASLANDYLASDGALQQLYDTPELTRFIGAVLGYDEFYCGADPLGAVSINVYGAGDGHQWHFDESRFSVTIMVQEADEGGEFDYVAGLRTDEAADLDGIARVLDGDLAQVRRLPFEAGALSIFGGRNTMHRVTPVAGERHRFVPVLTYDTEPGSMNSDQVRTMFWGRTEALAR